MWVDFYMAHLFGFAVSSLFFLREIFTARAASPPVDTEPATINPTVVKQNGHIVTSRVVKLQRSASILVTGQVGRFLQGEKKKSAPFFEQELSHGRIFSQANRPVISVQRLRRLAKLLQEVGANGPVGLIRRNRV